MESSRKALMAVGVTVMCVACSGQLGRPRTATAPRPRPVAPVASTAPVPPPSLKVRLDELAAPPAVSALATVKSVEPQTRTVKLKTEAGRWLTARVDDRVEHLDLLHGGDHISATYYAFELRRLDSAKRKSDGARPIIRLVEPLPVSPVGSRRSATGEVLWIYAKANPSFMLEEKGGDRLLVQVQDPKKLEDLEVGDVVEVTYLEGLVVAIAPPGVPRTP